MDGLADELAGLDPAAADAARARTRDVFADAIRGEFAGELTDADRKRVEGQLALLEARDADRAARLRELYRQRLGTWQPAFDLHEPFDALAVVFDLARVQVEGPAVLPRPTGGPTAPLVRTRVPSPGPVQLEAVFAPSWSSAPAVGLTLNDSDAGRYQFLVCVPEYIPGQDEANLGRLPSLAATLRDHERARVCVLRDNAVLTQSLASLPAGELRLFARRVGDRLTFQVNGTPPLVFEDPFPLRPDRPGAYGLFWPAGVGLTRLRGERQLLPAQPSPLERGDELYVAGDYAGALALYREQARQAGDTPLGRQARYKQAVCLADLGREAEAVPAWEELFAKLPANPDVEEARWPVQAACRLWLWSLRTSADAEKTREATDRLLERLPSAYSSDRLAALVPAEVRKEILDQLRLRGPRWRSAYKADDDIDQLKRAMKAEELLNESTYERHLTAWRLSDAYRVNHQTEQALLVMVNLLDDPSLAPDERLAFSRDLVWIDLEAGRPADALKKADELVERAGTNPALQPLRLERARALVALKRVPEAEREVEEFFRGVDRSLLDYADFADACLLRGFLRAERGDEPGAKAAWREGLYSNWPGGIPPLPRLRAPSGIALNNRGNAITFAIQLASLAGEIDTREATALLEHLMSGTGTAEATVRTFARKSFPPEFVRDVLARNALPPHGRAIARLMAYRQLGLYTFFVDPLRVSLAEGMKVSAAFPPMTPELEAVIWKGTQDLVDYYNKRVIDDPEIQAILRIWTGKNDPESNWEKLAPKLEPDLRVPTAAYFGCRYVKLGKPEVAARFFREVIDRTKPGELLHRLAAEELAKLKPS
jgi:tetratricopeptide (TPR) repeat protein